MSNVGFWFLLLFVLISTSRIFDFYLAGLHLPIIMSVIAAAFTFASGGLRVAFETKIGKWMVLFAAWFMICIPFSEWRGGSFGLFMDIWSKSFMVFLMVAGSTTTVPRVRRMMITIGLGAVGAMILALVFRFRLDGRLALPLGYLANPNDLAQIMLVGMCMLPVLGTGNMFARGLGYAMMLPFLYTVFETSSRSALLAVMLLAGLVFLYSSGGRKMVLLLLFVLLGAGMFSVSSTARTRLATIFSSENAATEIQRQAVDSSESRLELLRQSILLTIYNPIFGVGPGVYQASSADLSHELGMRALWRETHNSYTEVSSETGIPGLIFFGGAVVSCITGLAKVRKRAIAPQHKTIRTLSTHLLAGFVSFAFTSFFSSVAYQFYFSLMIGICAAAIRVMNRDLAVDAPPPQPGAAVPTGPLPPAPVYAPGRARG